MFDILESDIIVMQELKIQRKDLRDDMVMLDGWDCYFSLPKHKKGYSGVGIYTRNATCAPIKAEEGLLGVLPSPSGPAFNELPSDESIGGYATEAQIAEIGIDPVDLDAEGRCVVVEFPAFVLLGVYCPANSNGLRDDFRYGFMGALDCRIRNLIRLGKRVVLVGDLNVSRLEIDTASALEDMRKTGISHEEYISSPNRRIFNQLLIGGDVFGERDEGREEGVLWDTTRAFHPERRGMYTHWEQKINARPGNYGSRIDFVLVSGSMQGWIKDANIQEGLLGSDHCPVFADFHDVVRVGDADLALIEAMSPTGTFANGERKMEWKQQSIPLFSAKRLPEFDKRRSIKSMFAAPSSKKTSITQAVVGSAAVKPLEVTNDTLPADISSKTYDTTPKIASSRLPGQASPSPVRRKQSLPGLTSPSPLKRKQSGSSMREKPGKKVKGDSQTLGSQQSLKGFFQPKDKATLVDTVSKSDAPVIANKGTSGEIAAHDPTLGDDGSSCASVPMQGISGSCRGDPSCRTPEPQSPSALSNGTPSPRQIASQVENAEQTQRSWGALFSRPVAPLCEHDEPCKSMLTKKKGSNQGRSFWMCARPLGPSGDKERGTQWRCSTFIWCSDWNGKKETGKEDTVT